MEATLKLTQIRESKIKYYERKLIGNNQWIDCRLELLSDSSVIWYKGKKPINKLVFDLKQQSYVGATWLSKRVYIEHSTEPPTIPKNASVNSLVSFDTPITCHWFLFDSDDHLQSWFEDVAKVLPKIRTMINQETEESFNTAMEAYGFDMSINHYSYCWKLAGILKNKEQP